MAAKHQQLLQKLSIKNSVETHWRSWDLSLSAAMKNCYRPPGRRAALPQNDSAVASPTAFPSPPDAGLLQRRPLVSRQNCMSIVSNSIINADAEARYLSPGELDQIKAFVAGGQRRLRVAQVLAESRERLVKQAGGALFQKRPDLISPGGNAYGEEMTATCLRDIDYYLRLVTYGVVAGDITPIEEIGIIGAREMYRALGTPLEAMAEAVRELKNAAQTVLPGSDAEEAGFYFDYVIGALS
jgi:allophycocyanin alpha subunit